MGPRNVQQELDGSWRYDTIAENVQGQSTNSSSADIESTLNYRLWNATDPFDEHSPHTTSPVEPSARADDWFMNPNVLQTGSNFTTGREDAHTTSNAYQQSLNKLIQTTCGGGTSSAINKPGDTIQRQSPNTILPTPLNVNDDDWETNNDLQETLFNSTRDRTTMPPPQLPTTPKRVATLDARIEEMKVILPWVRGTDACDTIVYIDPPTIHDDRNREYSDAVRSHFREGSFIKSSSLRKLQSTRFDRMLGESYQILVREKRKITKLPSGIRYIIDLTPRNEGDEAVEAVMKISCPSGILKWPESHIRWDVSKALVLGRDELSEEFFSNKRYCSEDQAANNPDTKKEEPKSSSPSSKTTDGKPPAKEIKLPPVEPEYTELRHRLAIERFLLALENQDPKLDSASKVWSAVKVSQAFHIFGHNPLTDYVARWLYADPNSRFIEALPEETIEIADTLRNGPFAIDAFSILVGEAVLDSATNHDPLSTRTFLDRRRGSIEESWQSRIEYARNSLKERVEGVFENLAGERMAWVERLPTLGSLNLTRSGATNAWKEAFQILLQLLKDYARGAIYHIICSTYEFTSKVTEDNDKAGGDDLYPRHFVQGSWNKTKPQARMFLGVFWEALSSFGFNHKSTMELSNSISSGDSDTNTNLSGIKYKRQGFAENATDLLSTSLCKEVKYDELAVAIRRCRNHLMSVGGDSTVNLAPDSSRCEKIGCNRRPYIQTVSTCRFCFRHLCVLHLPSMRHECKHKGKSSSAEVMTEFSFPPKATSSNFLTELPHRPLYTGNFTYHTQETINESSTSLSIADTEPLPYVHYSQAIANIENVRSDDGKKCDLQFKKTLSELCEPVSDGKERFWKTSEGEVEDGQVRQRSTNNMQLPPSYESINKEDTADSVRTSETEQPPPPKYEASPLTTLRIDAHTITIMGRLLNEMQQHIRSVGVSLSGPAVGSQIGDNIDLNLTQVLVCLSEEETKFLPLWAGGCDDGTNGVFNGAVPFADDGFRGPPATTNEYTVNGSRGDYDFMDDDSKTIATSAMANDGHGDTLRRAHVYAVSEIESVDWSDVRDRTASQASAPCAANVEEDLDVISESGIATPTATTVKKSLDLETLDDAFMDFPDSLSDDDDWGDEIDSPGSGEMNEMSGTENDDEEGLGTESVSYGGFSGSGSSPSSVVNVGLSDAASRASDAPTKSRPGVPQNLSSRKGSNARPVANTIADELKSLDSNTWIVYKDGPEDDLLTRL